MGFSEAGNHGKPWFSRLPDQLLKRTAVTFGWRLFSGSSFVVGRLSLRRPDAGHLALNVLALWAAGTDLPSANPYAVGVRVPVRFVGPDPRRTGRTYCSPAVRPRALPSALFTCPSAACSALHRTLSVRHPGLWPGISGSRAGGSFCRSTCWWAVLSGRFL